MDNEFTRHLSAAVRAGWQVAVIVLLLMLATSGIYLLLMHTRPDWLLTFLGYDKGDWASYRDLWLWAVAAFKVGALLLLTVLGWATFWSRALRRAG